MNALDRKLADSLCRTIRDNIQPSRMSRAEALDVLELVIEELKGECEALREEMDDDD